MTEAQWERLQAYRRPGYTIEQLDRRVLVKHAKDMGFIWLQDNANIWRLSVPMQDVIFTSARFATILLVQSDYELQQVATKQILRLSRGQLASLLDDQRQMLFHVPICDVQQDIAAGAAFLSWYSPYKRTFCTCELEPDAVIAELQYQWDDGHAEPVGIQEKVRCVCCNEDSYSISRTAKDTAWHRVYETMQRKDMLQEYLLHVRAQWDHLSVSEFLEQIEQSSLSNQLKVMSYEEMQTRKLVG